LVIEQISRHFHALISLALTPTSLHSFSLHDALPIYFLVGPRSKGVKGNFRMDITVEAGVFINREQKVMLVVEPKLVWTPSQEVEDFTQIMVKDSLGTQPINISVDIEQQFLASFTANNVIGMLRGKEQPDSFIVITAHYDHLGGMGRDVYFPGANDNASGVAL